jgi:hypothetical protein
MELGASALATMWVNITGLSIVYGGASALDSLAAQVRLKGGGAPHAHRAPSLTVPPRAAHRQAYGAKAYPMVGMWSLRFTLIVSLLCVPICLAWCS